MLKFKNLTLGCIEYSHGLQAIKKENCGEELYSVRKNMAPNAGIILTALFLKLAKEKKGARHLENYIHISHIHVYTYKA